MKTIGTKELYLQMFNMIISSIIFKTFVEVSPSIRDKITNELWNKVANKVRENTANIIRSQINVQLKKN